MQLSAVALPTYFVSRSSEPPRSLPPDAEAAIHAVDNFFTVEGDELVEWAVIVTSDGVLHALRAESRATFPSEIQTQLAFNEVARTKSARILDLSEFYLFDLNVAEQPSDEPGLNDPVYLYGTLSGPYGSGADDAAVSLEGQLTLTRADVLEGVIRGRSHGFRYANPAGAGGPASECFHLMLPAGREDQIQRGRGIALAYPLMPAELLTANPANEIVVNQLVFDMLTAMKQDASKSKEKNPLRTLLLPVPSRSLLEQELVKQGFRIAGNTAVKTPQATGMVGEVLLAVFGDYIQKKVEIPGEGTIDQFVDIAQKAVQALGGWPTSRSVSLQSRLKQSWPLAKPVPKVEIPLPEPAPIQPPQPPVFTPKPARAPDPIPPRPKIYKPHTKASPDWMQDFVDAHRKPGRPAPKLTRVHEFEPTRHEKAKKPDWMKDFD